MVQVRRRNYGVAAAAGLAAVYTFSPSFVPAPRGKAPPSWAVPSAVLAAASASAPAHAFFSADLLKDPIAMAASKLSGEAYPLLKEIDWNSYAYLLKPGSAGDAAAWAKAIDKAIVMGTQIDSRVLREAVEAHHKAIGRTSAENPCISQPDFENILIKIGHLIANVPEKTVMDVYDAFKGLVDAKAPAYLMSTVNERDAKTAYEAFLKFKDVVKKNPFNAEEQLMYLNRPEPAAIVAKSEYIDGAAAALSKAAYPFVKTIDWKSNLPLTPLPGVKPHDVITAIDKALVMGVDMNGPLVKKAGEAHHKALQSMDGKLVTTESDFTAINAALGKAIASAPQRDVMDVYNAFAKLLPDGVVANNLFSLVGKPEAVASYSSFLTFKDAVKSVMVR